MITLLSHVGWLVGKPIRRVGAEIDNNIRVPNSSKLGIKSARNVLVKRRYGQAILPISGTGAPAQYFAGFLSIGRLHSSYKAFILNKILLRLKMGLWMQVNKGLGLLGRVSLFWWSEVQIRSNTCFAATAVSKADKIKL